MDTKKLRQKILDLAIRGKLVPQDPNDEPAIELLKRINPKFVPCENGFVTTQIPDNWCWVRGIDIFEPMKSTQPHGDTFKYIDIDAIDNKRNIITSVKVLNSREAPSRASRYTEKGNVLFSMVRPYLRNISMVTEDSCIASTGFYVCGEKECLDSHFCLYLMLSDYVVSGLNEFMKGDNSPSINKSHIDSFAFPLPPLSEQKRIVAAIEQWFSLIDILENEKSDLQASIQQAKSKILDLAIHGKLVPQDPNDEPAIELLKRINPKFEACDNVLDTTQLPDSWCWAKLESISTDSADGPFGSNLKKEHYTTNKEVRIIQLSNIGDEGWREENTKYTTFEHLKDISRSEVLPNDIVIAKMMPAGRAILCPNNEHKYVLSSDAVKFHIVDKIDCRYILYAINSDMFRKQVYENVQGVTRVRTSLQKLRKYCLPIPPYQEQLRIVAKIEELFAVLDSIKESLE